MTKKVLKVGDIIDCKNINGDYTGLACVVQVQDGWPKTIERADGGGWSRSRDGKIPKTYKKRYSDKYWSIERGYGGTFEIVTPVKPAVTDDKAMDSLVLEKTAKNEIEAVLKQHKNSETIFKEWGLGSVIEYGRAMSFLFYGGPGTGKTWAAHCIAKTLGKELLSIGAAEIQTSEPGGANRNIVQAFKSAKEDDKVLFLDECDSLITSRNDVGMVLGSEINTLLTEIEKYEGVIVLATNRIERLDEALERRISLIVEFKDPDHVSRTAIWKRMLPKKMPLAEGVTAEKLAAHKLTGGQIKNAVLQAARLALASNSKTVEMAHFEAAISRINQSKSLLGTASRYGQHIKMDVGVRKDTVKADPEITTASHD